MQSVITRLAMFQFLLVLYCTLGVGVLIKAFSGLGTSPVFATHLRNYGVVLLLLPAAWLIWASVCAHRPKVGTGDLPSILLSGFMVLGVLIVVAVIGTFSAMAAGTLVKRAPSPKTPAADYR